MGIRSSVDHLSDDWHKYMYVHGSLMGLADRFPPALLLLQPLPFLGLFPPLDLKESFLLSALC